MGNGYMKRPRPNQSIKVTLLLEHRKPISCPLVLRETREYRLKVCARGIPEVWRRATTDEVDLLAACEKPKQSVKSCCLCGVSAKALCRTETPVAKGHRLNRVASRTAELLHDDLE